MIIVSKDILRAEIKRSLLSVLRLCLDILEMEKEGETKEMIKIVTDIRINGITDEILMWTEAQKDN